MTPTQRKDKDDLLYDQQSPVDRQRGRMMDRTRDGVDGVTHVDTFKSALQANNSTALQVQIDAAQKAWSVAPETASDDYFRMQRQSELQDRQFVAGSMVHARVERRDMRPAIGSGDARVHDSSAGQMMRAVKKGCLVCSGAG